MLQSFRKGVDQVAVSFTIAEGVDECYGIAKFI